MEALDIIGEKKKRSPPPPQPSSPSKKLRETSEWKVQVKKENDFIYQIAFPACPSYDQLVERVSVKLKMKPEQINVIANGKLVVDEDSIHTFGQGEEFVVYPTQ